MIHLCNKVVIQFQETIEEHREILDPNNPVDLIDHYLIEMERRTNDSTSHFTGTVVEFYITELCLLPKF